MNAKPLATGLVLLILGGTSWILIPKEAPPSEGQDLGSFRQPSSKIRSPLEEQKLALARKTGISTSLMNPCVLDILSAYETKDAAAIEAAVLKWLEKDEDLLLNSIEAFDNLNNIYGYGVDFPVTKVSEQLYQKYGGERTIELLASLSRTSNTVQMLTIGTMRAWGGDRLPDALNFIKENEHFSSEAAVLYMAEDQASLADGGTQEMAEFFTKFPDSDPRKARALESIYHSWVERDPDTFGDYLNTVDDLKPAASAIDSYSVYAAQHDLDAALEWMEMVPGERQKTARVSVAAELALQDPERFETWLENQEFSTELEKERFLSGVISMRDALRDFVPDETHPAEHFNIGLGLGPQD